MSAWTAALRIARRDALRHRWRSLLIIVLILAPVAAGTGVDILYRTQTSAELERERTFGGADALVETQPIQAGQRTLTQAQLQAALPAGSRLLFERYDSETVFTTPGRIAQASYQVTDHLGDPMTRANVRLKSGRAPGVGDEVAISPELADRLGLPGDGVGSTIALKDGTKSTVTGIVQDPFCLSCPLATMTTTSAMATSISRGVNEGRLSGSYYVDLPADYDNAPSARLGALLDTGAYVQTRSEYGSYQLGLSDLTRVSNEDIKAVALVTLIAGLGLLEVVLLAGTAFAVGARRQTRDLGMLAAQGGSPRDLRRVVLAQGLLLGLVGAVAGVGLGFGAVIASRPLLERVSNEVMVGVHFGVVEIVVIAAVGFLSGLGAALIPAVAASRRRPVDALAARFPVPTARSRVAPIVGALLIASGAGLSLVASYFMSHGPALSGYVGYAVGPDGRVPRVARLDDTTGSIAILVGVFIVVAGLLLLTPLLLACLAKLADRMPAILRLATRDAARHRHRTGPATAAIAVAVGGAVAISCLIASDREGTNSFEADAVPDRVIALSTQGALDQSQIAPATAAITKLIPGAKVIQVVMGLPKPIKGAVDSTGDQLIIEAPDGGRVARVGLADADLAALASGRTASIAEVQAAFDAGKAVVFDRNLVGTDGTVGIFDGTFDKSDLPVLIRVPAVALTRDTPYRELPDAFVPQSVVTANDWDTLQTTTLVSYPATSRAQAGAAIQIAEQLGIPVQTSDEERDVARLIRLGLTAAAALIALLGVAMCVALSAAEGRPDLATLSAIGAPPGRRRRLAGAQALVLALLGTVLGVAFGFYFARAARPATGAGETVVPWGDLLVTVAAVPLLAVLVAMLGTFGRIPMTRRVD